MSRTVNLLVVHVRLFFKAVAITVRHRSRIRSSAIASADQIENGSKIFSLMAEVQLSTRTTECLRIVTLDGIVQTSGRQQFLMEAEPVFGEPEPELELE